MLATTFLLVNVIIGYLIPYFFIKWIYYRLLFQHFQLIYTKEHLFTKTMFALTISVCFHSHFILIMDVMTMNSDGEENYFNQSKRWLLALDIYILLTLLVFIFPMTMSWLMTRTIITYRKLGTILGQMLFLFTAWQLGSLFPSGQNGKLIISSWSLFISN
jgi:hypothetical protein